MTTVLIEGLGLIGGSLALALKQKVADTYLIGLDQNLDSLRYAQAAGIIDEAGTNLAAVAPRADVIILATPVKNIAATLRQLANLKLKPNVIVTDTGSTKQTVLRAAEPLLAQGITVIGGHPMAGSHKSGVQAANLDLFRSAYYFLVPAQHVAPKQVVHLQQLLAGTQAKFLQVAPAEHDHIVAMLSHVPHMLAATLVNETTHQFQDSPTALRLAAGGFRDMTRIASSDPQMWTDILLTNTAAIQQILHRYITDLTNLEQAMTTRDQTALLAFFQQAKVTRDAIDPQKAGAIPGFFDIFVDIPDRTGAIAKVTTILAQAQIQLVNLQILETREELNGILQLTFASAVAQQQAQQLLAAKQISILRRA
ncbi:prephenate dehydrogenase [Loigolactobacillus zhaoyuanensis]|uniref:prephenate dehydrogenase n=1 Tax=Loigolactobacillus zhaoyuanensis TaxID=2486017 RepID=UPI000F7497A2|nr:prephenate dehydrogenase [Loigolactobacillus zhaoyuanensis]